MVSYKRGKGFTLIELMIAIAVMAIIAGIAIPRFNEQILNNRSVDLAEELVDAIGFARSQAVSRPARISICASNTGTTCEGLWSEGYIVFVDNVTSDTTTPADLGVILKFSQRARGNPEISVAFGETPTSLIRFTSTGTLARLSTDALKINTKMADCKGNYAREISITLAGQSTVIPRGCEIPVEQN